MSTYSTVTSRHIVAIHGMLHHFDAAYSNGMSDNANTRTWELCMHMQRTRRESAWCRKLGREMTREWLQRDDSVG